MLIIRYIPSTQIVYASKAPKDTSSSIKELIQNKFGDDSVMVRVAFCESRHRQFNKNGTILRGKENKKDVGVFQINERWNLEESKRVGNNIYTIEGNIEHAKYMYDRYGTKPWNWSRWCWSK